ncbi:golvesin C-terminal-like domain-containing protein [Streptomyces litchfieldiae]|uniref:Golvesin/Xly CBD-like domain-containing protein n=1 Tax=Streptomyces litchfieldiae TaxID=3075543 RepID=A0ABU2MSN5_9ACTN|nr:hypothetical protein [Streptomyces sp. DSM 44938]MDT0344545.1 hypothetical protein [Streptomyces sp. DSM 44938]
MRRRHRLWGTGVLATALAVGLLQAPASRADEAGPQSVYDIWDQLEPAAPAVEPAPEAPPSVAEDERAELLGGDWESSNDRAWTTTGDVTGFHLLVADASDGYAWRTAATLAEPGFDADSWIGNACVTGDGEWAVAVYAPRTFTNEPELMARGGFTAVVNLDSGEVTKLPQQASLSYYNPGCGVGDTAVLTQSGGEDLNGTRLTVLDVPGGELAEPVEVEGQVTSAVPVEDTIYAAGAGGVVRVGDDGELTDVAGTDNVPYRLTPDADGGLVFMDHDGEETARAMRLTGRQLDRGGAEPATLAEGPLTGTGLTRTAAGQVWLTGETEQVADELPAQVRVLPDTPREATASTRGEALIGGVAWADGGDSRTTAEAEWGASRPVRVDMTAMATEEDLGFTVTPDPVAATGPAEAEQDTPETLASRTEVVESERTCSVPRNSPTDQALQPKPRQVEWAVDQAINNTLNNHISRPANWKNLGMPAYQPQSADMFPRPALAGGGRVPAQVLLGVTAQESNMWQASRYTVPGVTGNPLIGNYYGIDYYDGDSSNDWTVDWAEADCGYGITQVTDHMRRAGHEDGGPAAWPYQKQRAVALDYTVNIAAGLSILSEKWNQTRNGGLTVNNGDPAKLENWFFALWAYNSGYYPQSQAGQNGGAWGVGWANNPANPEWDPARDNFMEDRYGNPQYADAAHPQDWPYQEKVLGFAAHPLEALEAPNTMVAGFRAAWWNGTEGDALTPGTAKYYRAGVKPPMTLFCTSANNCDPGAITSPSGPCERSDYRCWWHAPVTWKDDCSYTCGNELVRFNSTYPEEPDGTAYPPNCALDDIPANALIVDNLDDDVPSVRPDCDKPWHQAGTYSVDFGPGELNDSGQRVWPAKVDYHQLGAGFAAGFTFAHGRELDVLGQRLNVEATWAFDNTVNSPGIVAVHLPDHGARTTYARYEIDTAYGTEVRRISQYGTGNRWVLLGAFMFDNQPVIRLDNSVPGGNGEDNVAFDAAMVIPVDGEFVEDTVEAVAYFDEDQNLDAHGSADFLATPFADRGSLYDWAMDRTGDVLDLPACTTQQTSSCAGPAMREAMQAWRTQVEEAGTHPTDHPDGSSIPAWLNFSNPVSQRPISTTRPDYFDTDDGSYKIRQSVTVSYIVLEDGYILDGTEYAEFDDRTGDTHLPQFVRDIFDAIEEDFGIEEPDLTYSATDMNEHDGRVTTTSTSATGILPGRAYDPVASGPLTIDRHGQPASDAVPAECVAVQYTSGGSIGYRPAVSDEALLHQPVGNWTAEVQSDLNVPAPVWLVASDISQHFFNSGALSLFRNAPPIWQELHFWSCADGGIRKPSGYSLLRSSFMPDQYLYHDGVAMNLDGNQTGSAHVWSGDFHSFSNPVPAISPIGDPSDTPYERCTNTSGHGGNPWGIDMFDAAGVNPEGQHCTNAPYLH